MREKNREVKQNYHFSPNLISNSNIHTFNIILLNHHSDHDTNVSLNHRNKYIWDISNKMTILRNYEAHKRPVYILAEVWHARVKYEWAPSNTKHSEISKCLFTLDSWFTEKTKSVDLLVEKCHLFQLRNEHSPGS